MTFVWQLIRIEVVRKWNMIAILIALWLFICFAFWMGIRSQYGARSAHEFSDVCAPIALGMPFIYALVLGAAFFQSGEKDGARFFLYHHPISRTRVYVVRYLTSLAFVAALSGLTIVATPALFSTTWEGALQTAGKQAKDFVRVLPALWLLVYAATAFFSPLFSSDLVTIPVSVVYSAMLAAVTALFAYVASRGFDRETNLVSLSIAWVIASAALLLVGGRLYAKRWLLEYSWGRRSVLAVVFFAASLVVLLILNFVDPIDLLYLMGVDVMKLGVN